MTGGGARPDVTDPDGQQHHDDREASGARGRPQAGDYWLAGVVRSEVAQYVDHAAVQALATRALLDHHGHGRWMHDVDVLDAVAVGLDAVARHLRSARAVLAPTDAGGSDE